MKHDIPDMNHDGKADSRDAALLHEMLDENRKETRTRRQASSVCSEPWTVHHGIAKGLLLALFGGLVLLCIGVVPLNGFTAVLAQIRLDFRFAIIGEASNRNGASKKRRRHKAFSSFLVDHQGFEPWTDRL